MLKVALTFLQIYKDLIW